MKINKYLKELGLDWCDLPGNYDGKLHNCGITKLENSAAADPRNKEDDEGFCEYEFFNLDHTMNLYIYSKISYYKEHIASLSTPGCFCSLDGCSDEAHQLWLKIIDEILEGFKIAIVGPQNKEEGICMYKVQKARFLLAQYWDCFWY